MSQELVPYPTPEGQPIWVHPDLLEDENWEIVKTKPTTQQRSQAKRQLRKLKQQEKAQTKQEVPVKAETSSISSLGATEESLPKASRVVRKFTLGDFMPPRLRDETTQRASYSCNLVVGFSMNGYESSDTASDTDEWEESLETGEYLSNEEWFPESHLIPSIVEVSSIEVACNVIVQDDSASEASSAEATDSQNASGSISSGATSSRPLPTDHHEEALVDEVFKENSVNWSQIPNLIGDVWTDEILDKEEKLLETVQDLFPENAPCNAITEDGDSAVEAFSENQEDQPREPEGGLPKEERPLESFEVGKGTRSGRDYHKNYNQPSSFSYVNPSGKQAVKAPSGNNNENAGPKDAFKYDLIEHFKHIPARLHILDLLRMSPQTRDSLISELRRLDLDVDKHAPQVLQIEMDYRDKKSKTFSKGEKKEARGPCTECLSVQKTVSATIAFNKEDLLLGETKNNRPLYFTGYIKEMPIHSSPDRLGFCIQPHLYFGTRRAGLQIGDLISEVTVYVIKTPSCYNILLGRPWIHENGVVPSTLHQCIKFVGDDGLIDRVFADKKPFKGKEVHFADSQIYRDEKEEKEEKIASFAGNLQKDKGKAPQQSSEENKPSGKPEESNQSPFVISFKSSKPLVITTKAKKTKQKTGGKFAVSFVSIIQDTDSDSKTEDDTSSSQADTQQV
ncbi:hypothetical protein AAC387_Pa10g0606 [Persea americana]